MKSSKIISLVLTLFIANVMATSAYAHDYKVGSIEIVHPWARASAGAAKSGVAFMMIRNAGATPDRLISISSPIAKKVHLHTTVMENDIMKMRSVDAVDIPAGGMAELKPGGLHVMFMGLNAPFVEGEMFPLTLMFEAAGALEIMVYVTEAGAMGSMEMDMSN